MGVYGLKLFQYVFYGNFYCKMTLLSYVTFLARVEYDDDVFDIIFILLELCEFVKSFFSCIHSK